MTDASPPEPSAAPAPPSGEVPVRGPRKPRKVFLLVGVVLAVVLGIFLFTGLGTNQNTSGAPYEGGPVPAFSQANVGPTGPHQVSVPADGGGNGSPAVLLFFGNWCSSCHQELPPLAAAVRQQQRAHGALAAIHVIGVDDLDSTGSARSFIRSAGVTFPVAYDPNASVTADTFKFDGDPYAVFVRGDGTIAKIVRGAVLTPSSLSADEKALIPSGT